MGVLKIGIVGAGIGGLAAANALHQAGHDVVVFEQSKQFLRVGADINLTPNAVRALDGLGAGIAQAGDLRVRTLMMVAGADTLTAHHLREWVSAS